MSPTWTILVPTLGQRHDLLCQMLDELLPQVDAQGGRVKVLAYWDNGEVSLAVKKQALLEAVDTDYLSFVDDDDAVSDDYVPAIVEALATRPDYVGLKLQVYLDGSPFVLSHHSLSHGCWTNEGAPYYRRDITCANPMRTSIAQTARFDIVSSGEPEDVPWVIQLRGRLRSEVFIDRVLYHYWWVPARSAWMHPDKKIRPVDEDGRPWRPLAVESPNFSWHPDSPLPEGDARGGPADHRAGPHTHLEHRAAADGLDRYGRVGRRRPAHRR